YALLQYHWSGYHSAKKNEPPALQTDEPPLASPPVVGTTKPGPRSGSSTSMKQSSDVPPVIQTIPPASKATFWSQPKASDPPKPKTPPVRDEGPSLFPAPR